MKLADCFTEDVILDMPPMPQTQGRNATVQLLAKTQGKASTIVVPQGHNPEIAITSDTTAKGTWSLNYNMLDVQGNKAVRRLGFYEYEDEYAKEDGKWKIKSTRVTRLFTERQEREV